MSSGGGSGGVDTAYNDRMATIAESQQAMAEKYFQFWESGPGHWEETTSGVDTSKLVKKTGYRTVGHGDMKEDEQYTYYLDPATGKKYNSLDEAKAGNTTSRTWITDPGAVSYSDMEQEQIKANMALIPKQTEYQSAYLDSETGMINKRAGLESAMIEEKMTNIGLRAPVTAKYYDEVTKGIDVNERMNLARADVEDAYAGAESNARRWASGMGINPASKKYGAGLMSLSKEKAAAKVGAVSLARRQAEEENFARLSGAMGLSAA